MTLIAVFTPLSTTLAQTATVPAVPRSAADEIVVSAEQKPVETLIDRKVYAVGRDLQAVAGSASDVLNNLPSVDIDASGGISIRGDVNIEVLIDGKPSSATSSGARGEYLQQLPASAIDRIEVISNPSARFKPDGATGIINIVMKKNRADGRTGSLQASGGSDERFNVGFSDAYRAGPLNVSGRFNLKRDIPYRPFGNTRVQDDPAGGQAVSVQDALIHSRRIAQIAALDVDYDLTPADRLTVGAEYSRRVGRPVIVQTNRAVDGRGSVVADFVRTGVGAERQISGDATATWRHSLAGKGHQLTLDLRRSRTREDQSRSFVNLSRDGGITSDRQAPRSDSRQHEATLEYARPLAGGAKLLLGYDVQRDDSSFRNRGDVLDPLSAAVVPDSAFTNRFDTVQTVHAAYGTWERPLSAKLTALLGLRAEATTLEVDARTATPLPDQDYVRVYPTMHLDYALSERRTLRLSYSRRIVRPSPSELNPNPLFQNPFNLRGGNPALRPQRTDSIEAAYAFAARKIVFEVTPYLRTSTNVFSDVSRAVSPGVLLTRQENLGESLAAGSEIVSAGPITPRLTYSASANIYYTRIDATNLGIAGRRALVTVSGKASLDWTASARDLVQITGTYAGKRLTPQGFRSTTPSFNLGVRHRLKPALAAVLTVSDIFDAARDRVTLVAFGLRDTAQFRRARRAATLALTYNFGGAAKPAAFDYTN